MSKADPRGKFVWHELLSADTAGAGAFYPKVVSWKPQAWEHDASYTLWMGKNGPIGGVMGMPAEPQRRATLDSVRRRGRSARHASPRRSPWAARSRRTSASLPNGGSYAVLTDPQGAEFAIYKSSTPYNGSAVAGRRGFRLARALHQRCRGARCVSTPSCSAGQPVRSTTWARRWACITCSCTTASSTAASSSHRTVMRRTGSATCAWTMWARRRMP